ncbi:hypothetical protein F1559_000393 [Cyanidiococcus yangmingshanensis]|uniref:Uncharacterized protein n=1 Tax=Cyanidiococcus yangmingshanensis TaxID=2690220 RepID=A0A7J7ICJ0_9RHOD|nr:hypothetical protein F1559_000393 [Cyanidiococcus yangmingshanensis]
MDQGYHTGLRRAPRADVQVVSGCVDNHSLVKGVRACSFASPKAGRSASLPGAFREHASQRESSVQWSSVSGHGDDTLAMPSSSEDVSAEPLYWHTNQPAIRRYVASGPRVESRLPAFWNYAGHYIAEAEPVDAAYMRPGFMDSQRGWPPTSLAPSDSASMRYWSTYQFGAQMGVVAPRWSAPVMASSLPQAGVPQRLVSAAGASSRPDGMPTTAWPGTLPGMSAWPATNAACPTVPHPAYWPMAPAQTGAQQASANAQQSGEGPRFVGTQATTATQSVALETETPASEVTQHSKKKSGRMAYVRFTEEEERLLLEGVALYGIGNWKAILSRMHGFHPKRTPMNLKDKFRNMLRARMRQSAGGRMRPNIAPLLIASTCGTDVVAAAQKRRKPSIRKTTLQSDIERIEESVLDGDSSVHAELARWIAQIKANSSSTWPSKGQPAVDASPDPCLNSCS